MSLQCPYHAWTYGLDGHLRRAPRAERNQAFDPDGISLLPLKVGTLGPFVFLNPNLDAQPVENYFGEWLDLLQEQGIDLAATLKIGERRTFDIAANWKLQCENNVECYHCPTIHPTLSRVAHTSEEIWCEEHELFFRFSVRTRREASGSDGFFELQEDDSRLPVAPDRGLDAVVNYLWPNFFFTIQPGTGIATASVLLPVSVDQSLLVKQYCFADSVPAQVRHDFMAFADSVFDEDRAIVASVQRGLGSGVYDRGRLLLPASETGIRWQEQLVYRAVMGNLTERE
jgi:choline monooxygenase